MIYLDESGDLGFGPHASRYFVLVAVIARDPGQVGRCINRVRGKRYPRNINKLALRYSVWVAE